MEAAQPKLLRLLVVDSEEIFGNIYSAIVSRHPIDLLPVSSDTHPDVTARTIANSSPDVLLRGTSKLDVGTMEELSGIRKNFPGIGIVLLISSYSMKDIEVLRNLTARGEGGMAIFLRQSLHRIDQLAGVIAAVGHGQVILDPTVASLMLTNRPENPYLKQLTGRELEILSLLSKGYTNLAISQTLYIDVKTVEHHLNSVYSKLKTEASFGGKHPRVAATILYLQGAGQLAA